jgi:hypothetical protein
MKSRLRGQLRPGSDYTLEEAGVECAFQKGLVFWVSSRSSEAELIENVFHHKIGSGWVCGDVTHQMQWAVIPNTSVNLLHAECASNVCISSALSLAKVGTRSRTYLVDLLAFEGYKIGENRRQVYASDGDACLFNGSGYRRELV